MMPKEMHGVKPCLLENATRQEPQKQPLLQKRQVCFSKLSGRHTIKLIGVIALVAVIGFTVVACGGGGGSDPKSLAKQSAELMKEITTLVQQGVTDINDHPKGATLQKKAEAVGAKVEKLSEADKKIYAEELGRLLK